MAIEENKKIVNAYLDAAVAGDLNAIDKLLADDIVTWIPGSLPISGTHKGKEAL